MLQLIEDWLKNPRTIQNNYEVVKMAVKNKVINGDYLNCNIENVQNKMLIIKSGHINIPISKRTVNSYVTINSNESKNTSNVIKRGIVGGVLAGGVGMLAGSITAKNDKSFQVMIKFNNNKSSVIEIDEKLYGVLAMSLI